MNDFLSVTDNSTINLHDWTLNSRSVDTDTYIGHLKRKSKNYELMRGLGNHESRRNLTKIERRLRVMEFMQNASTKNPFRALKLKKLLEKQGDTRHMQKLRQMLQYEELNVKSSTIPSDDQSQISQNLKRGSHAHDLPKKF